MKSKKQYIDKGTYSHPQTSGYLTVKQFLLVEREGKRCLLLRFANEADFAIDRAEFVLKQLDAAGNVIGSANIRYDGIKVGAGELFAPKNGIVVDDNCVDFLIQMVYVASESYKYVFRNGLVTAYYENREHVNKGAKRKSESKVTVRQRYKGGGRLYGLLALLALVLVIGSFIYAVYDTYKPKESEETLASGNVEQWDGETVGIADIYDGVYVETNITVVPNYKYEVSTVN